MTIRGMALVGIIAQAALAQVGVWQVPSPPCADVLWQIAPFGDYDGDGYRDFLHYRGVNWQSSGLIAVQVLSGRDAHVLWQNQGNFHAGIAYAGDANGDGRPDIAIIQGYWWTTLRDVQIWSPATNQVLWSQVGIDDYYCYSMVGDLDLDGDGRSEFVTHNMGSSSTAVVYNSNGTVRYTTPGQGGVVTSVGKAGDINGDGHPEILVGINDVTGRGLVLVVSGFSGTIIRQHQGQLIGDKTCDFVRSMGDLDGDGIDDYAAFPWITAARDIVLVWSGATGNLIRTWNEFPNSVITGEDFDRDGVPDMVIGADWLTPSGAYGRTRMYSGRDGAELWRVENAPFTPYGQGTNGSYGWMEYSASLGVQPGNAYPTIAWLDVDWAVVGTLNGRVRAFHTNFIGQGAVRGRACSSQPTRPLIGVRRQPTAPVGQNPARVTVARGPTGAIGLLLLGFANQTSYAGVPLPIRVDSLGLTGCELQVAPIVSVLTLLGTTGIDAGYSYVDLNRSFAPAAVGTRVAAQWLMLDPANLKFGGSEVHELSLQ